MTRSRRLSVKDIGSITPNLSRFEGFGHILSVYEFSTGAVEDNHLVTHFSDFGSINHVLCLIVKKTVK
jgi:hypothetical protein